MEIFTLDTRDIFIWDSLKDNFSLSNLDMHKEFISAFQELNEKLEGINLPYKKFRKLLVPNPSKLEICFVFDSTLTDNEISYGNEIFKMIIPEILNINRFALFYGDLIGAEGRESQIILRDEILNNISDSSRINYLHSSQYFLVYLNNINIKKGNEIDDLLKKYPAYMGFLDLTFSCYLKNVVSSSIGQRLIKYDQNLIVSTPEDDEINPNAYLIFDIPKDKAFNIYGINYVLFGTFLSFKIERSYYDFDNLDQQNCLNSVTESPVLLKDYLIEIKKEKLEYLRKNKKGALEILDLETLEKSDLIELLNKRINSNAIYNMEYSTEYELVKFITYIELFSNNKKKKYLCSFKIDEKNNKLDLITMY